MTVWAVLLTRLEVVLAVVALVGAAKSAYNGVLGTVWRNINMIPEIDERQRKLADTQEKMVDATVALSIAESDDGRTVNPQEVERTLKEDGGVRDFLHQSRNGRTPYADVEDEEEISEEEARWRRRYDDG